MASTYEPIATTTLGSTTTTVTFDSISGIYTDLILQGIFARVTTGGQGCGVRFNGDSGTNYSFTALWGSGTAAGSNRGSNNSNMALMSYDLSSSTTDLIPVNIHILNYSNTTTYKTALCRYGQSGAFAASNVGLWRSTSAVTKIEISSFAAGQFGSGSTFTLYGIKAA